MIKRFKKLFIFILPLFLLGGCGAAQLPEGDVKIVNQDLSGVIGLLLESADYGGNQSAVLSMLLPKDETYEISLAVEHFENGELVETNQLPTYTTDVVEKNSIIHLVFNMGKETTPSIISIGEVDKEATTDKKNPQYKVTKNYLEPLDVEPFDMRFMIEQYGGDLGEEVVLGAYLSDEVEEFDFTNYQEVVGHMEEAYVVKVVINQK